MAKSNQNLTFWEYFTQWLPSVINIRNAVIILGRDKLCIKIKLLHILRRVRYWLGLVIHLPIQGTDVKRCRFDPWVRKFPWRRKWQPNPVFLPGGSLAQRSLAGYSPCGRSIISANYIVWDPFPLWILIMEVPLHWARNLPPSAPKCS